MGVLETSTKEFETTLTNEQLFYELVYNYTVNEFLRSYNVISPLLRMPKIEFELNKDKSNYNVKYVEKMENKEVYASLTSLRDLTSSLEQDYEKRFKKKIDKDPINSLESIDYLLKDMYRKKLISYDSRCKLLRDIAAITALDYVYGVGSRKAEDFDLYQKNDCGQSCYRLLGVRGNYAFSSNTTRFTIISTGGSKVSYDNSIFNFANRINFKDFTDYFQKSYEKIIGLIDDNTFVRILYHVKDMYNKEFEDVDTYMTERNYFSQRSLKLKHKKLDLYR